jgi:HEAT repeat protein
VAILEALGAMQTPVAERFLKTELESMDRERQRAAATALSRNFREGNLALFARLARSQDWALRNTAAWALGEIGGEESREVLRSLVADPQEVVARTARAALERRR